MYFLAQIVLSFVNSLFIKRRVFLFRCPVKLTLFCFSISLFSLLMKQVYLTFRKVFAPYRKLPGEEICRRWREWFKTAIFATKAYVWPPLYNGVLTKTLQVRLLPQSAAFLLSSILRTAFVFLKNRTAVFQEIKIWSTNITKVNKNYVDIADFYVFLLYIHNFYQLACSIESTNLWSIPA